MYLVGETALIHVKVTRPAHEDPAGEGIELDPPKSEPARDIYVGAGIHDDVGNTFLFGFAVTNEKGKATLEIELEEGTDPGEVTADFYAWKDVVRAPCLTIREFGFRTYEKFFRVVKP